MRGGFLGGEGGLQRLGLVLGGVDAALTGSPRSLQTSLLMNEAFRDIKEREAQQRQQQVADASVRSMMNTANVVGTPQTRAFEVNGRTVGQNAAATPLVSQASNMRNLQRGAGQAFNAAYLQSMISQAFAPPPAPVALSEGAVLTNPQTGEIVARNPRMERPEAPMTGIGKAAADLQAGRITLQQYEAIVANETRGPQQQTYSMLSNQEKAVLGLPLDAPYQRSSTGQISAVSTPGAGKEPTEGQLVASGFADRMINAGNIISGLEAGATDEAGNVIQEPFSPATISGRFSTNIAGRFQSPQLQQYRQAQEDWVRAKLRKESGAVIGDEEMASEIKTYFPQYGDSPEVIAQKARARQIATQAMIRSAGRAYEQPQTTQGWSITPVN